MYCLNTKKNLTNTTKLHMKEENSDSTFMISFRGGDVVAFEKVWNEYYGKLYMHALNFIDDPDLAQEAVVKAFIRLWKVRPGMESALHIKHFLYRAVKHAAFDVLKSAKRRSARLMSVPDYNELADRAVDESAAADHNIIRAELRAKLFKEINALPEKCREAFQLHFLKNVPVKDIADQLGIGKQTVRDRVNEALRKLRLGPLKKEI